MADQPYLSFDQDKVLKSRHGNVLFRPKRMYNLWNRWAGNPNLPDPRWPAGLAALQAVVRAAEQDNLSVRGLGAGWSLSEAAASKDFMANTAGLNFIKIGLDAAHCDPALAGVRDRLVFAQCGAAVLELNDSLAARQLSLATSGASNGQTIGGAISTGTHGSANQVGSMQDFVLGLHLVSEGGEHCWIEPESRPAVSQSFCAHLGTRLIRNDDLFNAARVSFGSFGLIHAVLLRAVPIYLLERYVRHFDYAQVRDILGTLEVAPLQLQGGADLPYHFGVVVNPYAAAAGQKGAFVTWMFQRPFEQLPPPSESMVTTDPGDELLGVIGNISDAVPALIPSVVSQLLTSQLPEDLMGKRATHGQTFGATNLTEGGLSCELGVALADAPRAVDAMIQVAQNHPLAGAIALRYVPPSEALLAFTKFAPFTCTIELVAVGSDRTLRAYDLIWDALERQQIPHTFHWGQCMRPNPEQLKQVFGDRLDRWLAARRSFLSPQGRATFANDLMRSWGIDQ